jgi:FAD/FMN-containing dehydrogenase
MHLNALSRRRRARRVLSRRAATGGGARARYDGDYPAGRRYHFAGAFTDRLDPELVRALVAHVAARPSAGCEVDVHHLGDAPAGDGPYPGVGRRYAVNVMAAWRDPRDDAVHRTWARGRELIAGDGYANFATDADGSVYGDETLVRLGALKRHWDPDNVFRLNQNVTPA